MRKFIAALMMATVLVLAGGLALGYDPPQLSPMPEKFKNIQIVSPSPDIPKEIADFVGVWEGVWKNRFGFPHPSRRGKLIIYEVYNNKVKFLWAIGDNPNSRIPGGWNNVESKIEDFEGKKSFSYFSTKAGRSAYFYLENWNLTGKMKELEIEMNRVK